MIESGFCRMSLLKAFIVAERGFECDGAQPLNGSLGALKKKKQYPKVPNIFPGVTFSE